MKIVISSNPYRDHGLRTAQEARRILQQGGAEVEMCLPFQPRKGDRVDIPRHLQLKNLSQELHGADFLICFGGDGTILHAARDATLHDIPVLGINMGSVGFMAELERGELEQLKRLTRGEYTMEERMMLDVQVKRGNKLIMQDLALNDAVISNGSVARVAELEVLADGTLAAAITGDGVIVATPTGSTAYSMSAGGPIVEPTSSCILVTPVCAHQLSARTMVLSRKRVVTVRLPSESRKHLFLSVDGGKALRLSGGDSVELCQSKHKTRLVRLTDRNFYQTIYQKLGGYTP